MYDLIGETDRKGKRKKKKIIFNKKRKYGIIL